MKTSFSPDLGVAVAHGDVEVKCSDDALAIRWANVLADHFREHLDEMLWQCQLLLIDAPEGSTEASLQMSHSVDDILIRLEVLVVVRREFNQRKLEEMLFRYLSCALGVTFDALNFLREIINAKNRAEVSDQNSEFGRWFAANGSMLGSLVVTDGDLSLSDVPTGLIESLVQQFGPEYLDGLDIILIGPDRIPMPREHSGSTSPSFSDLLGANSALANFRSRRPNGNDNSEKDMSFLSRRGLFGR